MASNHFCGLVLAAGKGTRMNSGLPKCLHKVSGVSMAAHALRALKGAGASSMAIILGHGGELLQASLEETAQIVWQKEQLGTGHAVMQSKKFLESCQGPVVILPGDAPLIESESVRTLVQAHRDAKATATVACVSLSDPTGYGRIVRGANGEFQKIIEEKDASAEVRAISEVGVSVYCFEPTALLEYLPKLKNNNSQSEYYLVDVLSMILAGKGMVHVHNFANSEEFEGVNDRWQLALAQSKMNTRILKRLAGTGVTLVNWQTISVDADCEVSPDVTLFEGTSLKGKTKLGSGCKIGPYSLVQDSNIGENCKIVMSHLVNCKVADRVAVGPFANVRPHSDISSDCKIGNFVEIKNAQLSSHVSASHLSYIGDAEIGENTNIGAGTIFCNYNGFSKNRVSVGKEVFVGSNSTLVAPITIGEGAMVAAGSVVTVDVPGQAAAFGRARTEIKAGWATEWRQRMRERKEEARRQSEEVTTETTPMRKSWD